MYTYRAEILRAIDDRTAALRLDLGFYNFIEDRFPIGDITVTVDGQPKQVSLRELITEPLADGGAALLAATHKAGPYSWTADLFLSPHPSLPPRGEGTRTLPPEGGDPEGGSAPNDSLLTTDYSPSLWHYAATATRVIDGDTIDAYVDLGFGSGTVDRLRFKDVYAPETVGRQRTDPEFIRGMRAKGYVKDRLAANGDRLELVSGKLGKFRRWIADIHLADSDLTLNEELLREGLAMTREEHEEAQRNRDAVMTNFQMGRSLRDQLDARAEAEGVKPGELIRRALEQYLSA